ncbi:ABC transporter permease [Saccharibacillus alkalitolerans]|uniref:ABC transporter permease subunit n=1 Tax=Saccharibacillus alkalitolerans TaxID=2705290 RepID=A0ABX0FDN1_9BACL|nr:ABC transporter permease [Saccharibacillus alkalitolerans]NGZ77943.1 ABC transporter permease subunit [Saccharibacillus alkalitolerans]
METAEKRVRSSWHEPIGRLYRKMLGIPGYRFWLLLLGAPVNLIVLVVWLARRGGGGYAELQASALRELRESGLERELKREFASQLEEKRRFFGQEPDARETEREVDRRAEERLWVRAGEIAAERARGGGVARNDYAAAFESLISNPLFAAAAAVIGFPMAILMLLYANPYSKYIFERLLMTLFVVVGVAALVFTILHLSPMDPAANILGQTATPDQIESFNRIYGLDRPYLAQLWDNVRGILTLDLGKSFAGNEDVASTILRKFPVTLLLASFALLLALLIALPIGILSAARRNSWLDYSFMFIALIGLSIPNFWQGLVFILGFSIKLGWLPATYTPGSLPSFIMPVIVLGTGLTAAVARMTRSSTLEVMNEDYILTAKAKGLGRSTVLMKHTVRNALIPIVTVVGLQFGGMLGGAAITEKVFNISGLGSYIVDKQFVPDIPAVMGGVVYTAIVISIVNVVIDVLYAFIDPRIRTKMKRY